MTPRIAFAGASSTGKTTLATWLAKCLGVPFCPEGARSTAESMGFVNEVGEARPYLVDQADLGTYTALLGDGTPQERLRAAKAAIEAYEPGHLTCRMLFQEELLHRKIIWETVQAKTGYVTDRTTCDNLSYTALHDVRGVSDEYIDAAEKHAASYSLIFFTPIHAFQSLGNDEARVSDAAYHRLYEMMLEGAILKAMENEGADYSEKVWQIGNSDLGARKMYIKGLCTDVFKYPWSDHE